MQTINTILRYSQLFGAAPLETTKNIKSLVLSLWTILIVTFYSWCSYVLTRTSLENETLISKITHTIYHINQLLILAVILVCCQRFKYRYRSFFYKVSLIIQDLLQEGHIINFEKMSLQHHRIMLGLLLLMISKLFCEFIINKNLAIQQNGYLLVPFVLTILCLSQYFFAMNLLRQILRTLNTIAKSFHEKDSNTNLSKLEFVQNTTMTTIVIVHDTVDSFGFVLLADSLATLLGVLIQLYELYDFWDLKEHPLEALDIARVGSQLIWIFLQLCKLWMLLYPQSAVKYEV